MRQARPYYKISHKAWYINLKGRPVRLGTEEDAAWDKYKALIQPVDKVVEVVRRFLDYHKTNSAPGTLGFYCKALDSFSRYINPTMRVSEIKPYHVTQWIDTIKPRSDNYKRNLIRAVKTCFKWAEDQEYIEQSPIRNIKVPPAVSRGDEAYLMPSQWDQLVNKVSKSRDRGAFLDIITVMKETGCRPQEVRKVEARQFDRIGRCWVIPKAESKGKKEARVIHLSDRAFEICQRLALKHPEGPLFRNSNGNSWRIQVLDYRCQRLSKKLSYRVTPYSIRHTFCTDAIIRGVDLQTIATLMGHSDLKMISRVYQHIRKRSDHIKEGLRKATGEVA
jgi:integrase